MKNLSFLTLSMLFLSSLASAKGRPDSDFRPENIGKLCQELEQSAKENLVNVPDGCWKISIFDSGRLSTVKDFYGEQFDKNASPGVPTLPERCHEIEKRVKALEDARTTLQVSCDDMGKKNAMAAMKKNNNGQKNAAGSVSEMYESVTTKAGRCATAVRSLTGDNPETAPAKEVKGKDDYFTVRKDWQKFSDKFMHRGAQKAATTSQFEGDKDSCSATATKFDKLQRSGQEVVFAIDKAISVGHYAGLRQKENYESVAGLKQTVGSLADENAAKLSEHKGTGQLDEDDPTTGSVPAPQPVPLYKNHD